MLQQSQERAKENLDVEPELVRLVYSSLPLTVLAILLNSVVLSIVLWNHIEHETIMIWFLVANSISSVRLAFYLKFNTLDSEQQAAIIWRHVIFASSAASGAIWGAASFLLFPQGEIVHQVFLAFILAGMSAGAVTTLSPMLSSLTAFVLFAMLPLVSRFLYVGTFIGYEMGVMALLFTIMVLSTARRLSDTMRELFLVRLKQQKAKKIIEYQAHYDPLTDLPNRRMLADRLKQEIARASRHKHLGAVLFLDLDYFKNTNDSLGHSVGDDLLVLVAQRIQQRLRGEDIVARLGGDEFIILLSEVGEEFSEATENAQIFADEIMELFTQPFDVNEHKLHITASIGIVLYPLGKVTPEDLLQKSDVAMYEAKDAGRNKIRLFVPEMQRSVNYQRQIEKGLRQALSDNLMELYYQPLFDVDNNIFAVEALLRWEHPEKGVISPADVIEIAERSGLIIQIGEWVMKTACSHMVQASEFSDLKMCINVSPREFEEPGFVNRVKSIFEETGVDPNNIRIEITEGIVMNNIEEAIDKMKDLSAIGVTFAIDDFGTGHSSLSYLKRLPVDLLKIDKSFVLDIATDPNDAIIVETIIAMAKHMHIDVVAEGVETEEILEFLKAKGCRKFQGYLFSYPVPFTDLFGNQEKQSSL